MPPSGDGVLELVVTKPEEKKMATGLDESVASHLMAESIQTHKFFMAETMGNIQHANNMLRAIGNKQFDQLDSVEAQANRAVTVTPIGEPTTKSP